MTLAMSGSTVNRTAGAAISSQQLDILTLEEASPEGLGPIIPPRRTTDAYWWHMGAMGTDPAMQIVGDFFITNILDRPVRLPQMELRYGLWGRKKVHGAIMVEGPNRYYEMYDIKPNDTRDSRADFWIFPPVQQANRPFVAHSVVFWLFADLNAAVSESSISHL